MEARGHAAARTHFGGRPVRVALGGDERLAQLAAGGSERAFVALYERYHDQLYRYCRSIVRNDTDAQDALQSTLAGAFAALRRGKRDAPLRPWLFRIAHNESVSMLRRRRPEEQLSELLTDSAGSTEERVEQRERLALLIADLHALPERQRGALVMRELNDLSHEQIAIALRTSVGAVKQTIFEARRALLEFAEGRTMACEAIQRTISDADGRALRGRRVRAHLRDCPACAAFAAAIHARRTALQAVAAPLPAIAASSLVARVLAGVTGEAAAGAGGMVAGTAGKTAGAVLASKALAGVVIVAGATVGTTTVVTHFRHPSTRTAPGTTAGATQGAPLLSGALGAPRMRQVAGTGAGPRAAGAAASPHAGSAGRAAPVGDSATSGAGAVPAGQSANSSTAGKGQTMHPLHPERGSTAVGRGASRGSGRAVPPGRAASGGSGRAVPPGRAASGGSGRAVPPGHAASKGDGRPVPPGHAASKGSGRPVPPGRAASKGNGRPAPPGHAASNGASHSPGPPATSGSATSKSDARPAPPGRAASQGDTHSPGPPPDPDRGAPQNPKPDRGASQSPGPPPDPGGGPSQKPKPDRGASHDASPTITPPAAPPPPRRARPV